MSCHRLHVISDKGRQDIALHGEERQKSLADIMRRHELPLNTRCGQRGLCDGCMVELVKGSLIHRSTKQTVTANGHGILVRGCEYHATPGQAVELRVPSRSLIAHEPQVVSDFRINVPWAHDPIAAGLGVAIDIGTTTVALALVDLSNGNVIANATAFNHQMHLGDDVLTRINLCLNNPDMVRQLQSAIVDRTLKPLIAHALKQAPEAGEISVVTVAANTTMLHLLAGADPTSLGIAPFTPTFLDHRVMTAGELGLDLPASTPVHLVPGAAAYVGADLVAGALASGLAYDDGPSLLVDVGTNGEIILKSGDTMLGCATAAGPAFEGAGLASGIRAGVGAIGRIRITRDPFAVQTQVIGDTRPIGVCGSAYVDFLAQARRAGVLTATGKLDPDAVPDAARYFSDQGRHGRALRVGRAAGSQPVVVTERDVASLMQAKAAIAAGILTLLARQGLKPADVKKLYVAGGFGLHLDHDSAIACGLLPEFDPRQIEVVGNTSLAGAYLALVDRTALPEFQRLAKRIDIVELNLDPEFESRYIEQLVLPDPVEGTTCP